MFKPSRAVSTERITIGLAGVLLLWGLLARPALAQQSAQPAASPQTQQVERAPRVFASDAGLVLNFVKPDKTGDFEEVIGRLREALQKSGKPERKQQAASWKVFRAAEAGNGGSVLYIFKIDPAVSGADYRVSTILSEAFPDEAQALYGRYAASYATGQNVVNMSLLAALGQ
jgi:hypothetical protein